MSFNLWVDAPRHFATFVAHNLHTSLTKIVTTVHAHHLVAVLAVACAVATVTDCPLTLEAEVVIVAMKAHGCIGSPGARASKLRAQLYVHLAALRSMAAPPALCISLLTCIYHIRIASLYCKCIGK